MWSYLSPFPRPARVPRRLHGAGRCRHGSGTQLLPGAGAAGRGSPVALGMSVRVVIAPSDCCWGVLWVLNRKAPQTAPVLSLLTVACYLKTTSSSAPASFPPPGKAPWNSLMTMSWSALFCLKKKKNTKKPTNLISCSGEPYITDVPICAVCLWQNDRCHLSLELAEAVGRGIEIFSGSSQCLQTARSLKRGLSKESCV